MGAASAISKRRSAAKEDATEPYEKRRKEIAIAAVRVFNRLGFKGASISAVATELGCNRASLYYYISSKKELFDEILREVAERNAGMVSRIAASKLSPRRKLHDVIVALMKSCGDHYPLIYIYVREDLTLVSDKRSAWSKHMRKLNQQAVDALIGIIEEGYADKSFRRAGEARFVAYGILGMISWTHRWFKPGTPGGLSAEEIGEIYAALPLSGLEASSARAPELSAQARQKIVRVVVS